MSFFTNLRADRLIEQIKSSTNLMGAETQKAIAKLKDAGPGAIDAVTVDPCTAVEGRLTAVWRSWMTPSRLSTSAPMYSPTDGANVKVAVVQLPALGYVSPALQ